MSMVMSDAQTGLMQGREEDDVIAIDNSALATQHRAEIDMQISTAKKYPRSVHRSRQDAITMATIDVLTAASCFYKVPRGGKNIEGPSVRLAEIFASAWGNMRFGARVIHEDDRFITAQGVAHDLETNNATTIEVRRRITDKNGRKFNDDMIAVTGNAAASIALRNALFRVIPRAYVDQVYIEAKRVAIGTQKTLVERRTALVSHITGKIGIPLARVLGAVSRVHEDDIDLNDLETLYGLATAVKDGEITPDVAFPMIPSADAPQPLADDGKSKSQKLAESLKAKGQATPPQTETAAEPAHDAKVTGTTTGNAAQGSDSQPSGEWAPDRGGQADESQQSTGDAAGSVTTALKLADFQAMTFEQAHQAFRKAEKDTGIVNKKMLPNAMFKLWGFDATKSTSEQWHQLYLAIMEGRVDKVTGVISPAKAGE